MQQAIEPSQVDEHTEVSDILDNAFSQLPDLDFVQNLFLTALAFFFDKFAPRYDNVPAFNVNLENLALHFLADESTYIARLSDIDLRGRKKNRHTDIDK